MCLAVPMKIVSRDGYNAQAELDGVSRQVSLRLVEEVQVGDYVLVHAGFAIERVDEDEAEETLKIMQQIASGKMENEIR